MTRDDGWSVAEPGTLRFDDDPIQEAEIRVMGGAVNVIGTDEPVARLEIAAVEGPPLLVSVSGERLVIGYRDLPWQGFLPWLAHRRRRRAVISLSLPRASRVSVGAVGAPVTLSGLAGRVTASSLRGDIRLLGLGGPTRVETVSGAVEAVGLRGPFHCHSVSGPLTMVDGASPSVRAESVGGDLVLDLAGTAPPDVRLTTVSGELVVRVPETAGAAVSASSVSGVLSCRLPGLPLDARGPRSFAGRLGAGSGTISCSSVSGPITLLPRPVPEHERPAASPLRKEV
ncbi:hypothetical protein RM844_04975 [Streptomyces sp. DSM 44915]|uniref:Adhesin domain-containing protein n=1 Tax=Streptomyces chisholmiae TaxID=3075540 RepID=A0ABU2JKZ5_9ACTN|nr:hypothetical protein [Streptomyces sp. DSM 44915]MDT0265640.1 hypothetical protein [Streptomyces sp. DSM 44915]